CSARRVTDVIYGVYKMPTGQSMQIADLSWWPKQTTWVESNFDVGYWSLDNKIWFRTCLSKIYAGKAQPHNAHHWANALKKYKFTLKIIQNYWSTSAKYLHDLLNL
ncbi:hypothetical protein F5I97DRAFT_1817861, partial [Phlebopus sp. FC_14]